MSLLNQMNDPQGSLSSIIGKQGNVEGSWTSMKLEDNNWFAEMAALIPRISGFTLYKWLEIVKAIFEEYPRVSGRAKLRLVFQRAADEGSRKLVNKCRALLKTIDDGETTSHEALRHLWEWAHRIDHKPREHRVQAFLKYLKEYEIEDFANPVDAIEHLLVEHDLYWGELETDETLCNAVLHCIRRDLNYVATEELTDKRARSWRKYLNNEWSKSAKEEYQKKNIKGKLWYKINRRNGRSRPLM